MPYYNENISDLVAEINVDQDEEALSKKAPNLTYDQKYVDFKASYGLGVDANKFRFIHYFGIPVENIHTLQLLFQELEQL